MSENIETLPTGWSEATIKDIVLEVVGGGTPSKKVPEYYKGSIPWFSVKDMKTLRPSDSLQHITEQAIDESSTNVVSANTVALATRIGLGKAIKPTVDYTINQDLKALILPNGVDPDFVLYWIVNNEKTISDLGSGTTVKGIRLEILYSLGLLLPPAKEQTRIVEKLEELLSDLDNGVAELHSAQTKLKQYRQSLLKSAVEGTLTEQWREENASNISESGEQLLARILKERRARWEEQKEAEFKDKGKKPPKNWKEKYPEPVKPDTSELPKLPEGWVWATLGQCFNVKVGATPSRKKPTYWNGSIPWASSGEVQFGTVLDTKEKITKEGLENSSTQINPKGSVLLGMIGEGKTRGQSAILDIEAANNQNCAAIWVPETGISSEFVFYWLWSRYETTRQGSSGNNQPALNKTLVEKMPIPISSIEEMSLIGIKLKEEFESASIKEEQIGKSILLLNIQSKNILKEAFSGKLVPQNSNDEPASELLKKIQQERAERAKQPKPRRTKKKAVKVVTMETLEQVLQKQDDWIDAQEAFKACGVADGTDTDRIEELYAELRKLDKAGRLDVERHGDYDKIKLKSE